jgi:hypothetical protein
MNTTNNLDQLANDKQMDSSFFGQVTTNITKNFCQSGLKLKSIPLQIMSDLQRLHRLGGFAVFNCKDAKSYYQKNLKDKGYSQQSFYRWNLAAEFANHKSLTITEENSTTFLAMAQVIKDDLNAVWLECLKIDSANYPQPKTIAEVKKSRKENKVSSKTISLQRNECKEIQDVNGRRSQAIETVFSKMKVEDTLFFQTIANQISNRLKELESDKYGYQSLNKEDLLKLLELIQQAEVDINNECKAA